MHRNLLRVPSTVLRRGPGWAPGKQRINIWNEKLPTTGKPIRSLIPACYIDANRYVLSFTRLGVQGTFPTRGEAAGRGAGWATSTADCRGTCAEQREERVGGARAQTRGRGRPPPDKSSSGRGGGLGPRVGSWPGPGPAPYPDVGRALPVVWGGGGEAVHCLGYVAWTHDRWAPLPSFPPRDTRNADGSVLQAGTREGGWSSPGSTFDIRGTREQPHPLSQLRQPPDEAGMWRGGELLAPPLGPPPAPPHVGAGV